MAVQGPISKADSARSKLGIDKKWLQEQFAAMDARTGFVPDPTVTAEKVRTLMLADGIRPEDNVFSRAILRERYPEDDPQGTGATDDAATGQD